MNDENDVTMPRASLNDTVNNQTGKTGTEKRPENEDGNQYPDGFKFVVLTIGLMAVVLVVALDNYIIGLFESGIWSVLVR